MKHLQRPGEEELPSDAWGTELSPLRDPGGAAQLLEEERQEKDGLSSISFLMVLGSGLIASLGKHHSHVEVARVAAMRVGCI